MKILFHEMVSRWIVRHAHPVTLSVNEGSLLWGSLRFFASLRMTEEGGQNDDPYLVTLSVSEGSCHSEPKAKSLASLRMTAEDAETDEQTIWVGLV